MKSPAIERYWRNLESVKSWYETTLIKLSPPELVTPLGINEWSFAEVCEHVFLAESLIAEYFFKDNQTGVGSPTWLNIIQRNVAHMVLSYGIKVPVPTETVVPKGQMSIEEIFQSWSILRSRIHEGLSKLSKTHPTTTIFLHPMMGPLNTEQTLKFLWLHSQYHKARMVRLSRKLKDGPHIS